jgi:hypothetical protein
VHRRGRHHGQQNYRSGTDQALCAVIHFDPRSIETCLRLCGRAILSYDKVREGRYKFISVIV